MTDVTPKAHQGRTIAVRFAWVHASNSCRKASTSNMFGRDIDAARADTVWAISLMEKLRPATWTVGQWVSPDRSSAYLGCTRPTLLMKTSTGYTTRYCGWSLGIRV